MSPPAPAPTEAPLAIEARDLEKVFRIPTHRVDSLKERVLRPFSSGDVRELRALDGISFDVHQGEFFAIVGRNGSGKSTLLKLLASIYRADAGTIRMAGRLAPFIELGVGFNPELTARENVVLNGVMMGLTPRETRRRLDAIVDFAELDEFVDLKLKNFSSGMMVRLAFSLMMEVDPDIYLIDEVLAVGDASFQQKCADAFRELKSAGKTIILVTHEMATVEEYSDRAMLIDDGKISWLGGPDEVGRRYLKVNFEQATSVGASSGGDEDGVRVVDAGIVDAAGGRVSSVEHGDQIRIQVEIETHRDFGGLAIGYLIVNNDDVEVCQLRAPIGGDPPPPVKAGERLRVTTALENVLTPGHYFVHCGVHLLSDGGGGINVAGATDFVVFGGSSNRGVVSLRQETTTQTLARTGG